MNSCTKLVGFQWSWLYEHQSIPVDRELAERIARLNMKPKTEGSVQSILNMCEPTPQLASSAERISRPVSSKMCGNYGLKVNHT